MARKILIDTDPGIDDAIALALALSEPALDVLAVTATGGNVAPDQATRNLQIILEQLDPPHWPRIGAALPDQIPRADAREIHGPDGLGGVDFRVSELQNRHRVPADLLSSGRGGFRKRLRVGRRILLDQGKTGRPPVQSER